MNEILMIFGMFLVTFTIRYIMCPLSGKFQFPDLMDRSLKYVPPAVLSAIILPSIMMPVDGKLWVSFSNAYLAGGICAFITGWFSKSLLLTIILGMASFLGWQWMNGTFF